ncbi:MAG: polysaccharide lyase [Akkermansiaceae bacterium]
MYPNLPTNVLRFIAIVLVGVLLSPLVAVAQKPAPKQEEKRRFRTHQVFSKTGPIIYQSDFAKHKLHLLNISEDNRYARPKNDPARLKIVPAPGLAKGIMAAQFTVPRKPNSYRSEISLPHEKGFQERWYGITHYLPKDWQIDHNRGADIVMQWHGIPGNFRATYPNLEISIQGEHWEVRQSYGSPQTKPTRTRTILKPPLQPGTWANWVIHAKWSPKADGLLRIWKNDQLVFEKKGPNLYGTIGIDYTPYLKTGIYHPEWYFNKPRKKELFEKDKNPVKKKETYVAKIIVGNEKASFEQITKLFPKLP